MLLSSDQDLETRNLLLTSVYFPRSGSSQAMMLYQCWVSAWDFRVCALLMEDASHAFRNHVMAMRRESTTVEQIFSLMLEKSLPPTTTA